MKSNPLVTIYIPCRNYGRFLRQSVESVYQQLYTNWELVIVDEGSDDDSVELAEELCRHFPAKTKLLQNKKPTGLQRLANMVLALANGKYMVRLDADDWFDENALLVMVAKLESSPDIGLVYGNYFYTDPNGNVLGVERRYKLGIEDNVGQLPPHGACTMFRTRSLKAVGGYSEDINAQDGWELWYKLYDRIGAASIDVPTFYYRQHGDSLSRDSNRLLQARSRIFERLSQSLNGDYGLKNVAVIPVKESYPGFEGVPFRDFGGCSLLERAINSAARSSKVSSVVVSSSSQRVLDYSEELERSGSVPPHLRVLRNEELGGRNIPIRELMIHAGEHFFSVEGEYPDAIAFLSLHAVYRQTSHIDKAFNVLRITESDTVTSVQEEREPMFSYGGDGLDLLNPGRFQDLIYDRERLYRFNGSIIASWWDVLQEHHLFGEKIAFIEMSAEDSIQIKHPSMLNLAAYGSGNSKE
ncbi:glycosyltransferase [Vibrio sp. S4M6]|uniref:glycosyltransferase family 2 protein n=1 Tax=Vibrio sinus TaxID=2946865 RepID=UPI002029C63C|nr:glycosyltransferase [Vibrio sinus]MCL9781541.1 glycosyltransferase [Vibrio sinus]